MLPIRYTNLKNYVAGKVAGKIFCVAGKIIELLQEISERKTQNNNLLESRRASFYREIVERMLLDRWIKLEDRRIP